MAGKSRRKGRSKFKPAPARRQRQPQRPTGAQVVNTAPARVTPPATYSGRGGYANPATGAGYGRDKSQQGFYWPSWFTPQVLENLYIESGAVRKFIDIPVDDLFIRWRTFTGDDPDAAKMMLQGESDVDFVKRLAESMKAARLYGTSLLIPVTREATLDTPLTISRIRAGDLIHFWVCHRFECQSSVVQRNPLEPGYGRPMYYRINTRYGGLVNVHHSRVIRFDGIAPLTATGFYRYDQEWGISSLHGVLPSIMQSAGAASDITQMITEANLKVMQIQNLSNAVGQQYSNDPEDLPFEQRHEMNLQHMNAYNMVYIDKEDGFVRIPSHFAGLPEIIDRYERQIARDADIPATRFSGQSPIGMNATGEGDMVNYAMRVAEQQKRDLSGPLSILDAIMARHLGLAEPPPYAFVSLLDMSEKAQAETAFVKAQAIEKISAAAMLDENEVRQMLDGDPVFGNLEPLDSYDAPPIGDPNV